MADLKLLFACGAYDRIEPLRQGKIIPKGIDLDVNTDLSPRELFDRLMESDEIDLAEFSSSEYIAMTAMGKNPFVALPVFPSKVFRHSYITINKTKGINRPKDLEGRRIGVPLYTMSAALWCRGVLEDDYGVDLSGVTWVQGAVEKPGPHGNGKSPPLLKPVKMEQNATPYSLGQLLARGDIDAIVGGVNPEELWTDPNVVRLWPNFREIEKDFYRRTKIHPIMHLLAIRKTTYEKNPWIAKPLYEAFDAAKNLAWKQACYSGAQKYMLPFLYADIEEVQDVFGGDPWPYGLEKNRPALEKAIELMHRHNMIGRKPSLQELFIDVGA